jgi:hypothetical protein
MNGVHFWTSVENRCHQLSESLAVASASADSALPSWARVINVSTRTAAVLTSVVEKTYIPHLTGVVFEDQPIPAPLALPW